MRSVVRRGLHRPESGSLNVYRCPRCLDWHVGHVRDVDIVEIHDEPTLA
jgi:hypothetical protein